VNEGVASGLPGAADFLNSHAGVTTLRGRHPMVPRFKLIQAPIKPLQGQKSNALLCGTGGPRRIRANVGFRRKPGPDQTCLVTLP